MARQAKVLIWNANGLQKRRNELRCLVQDLNADLVLISETHLRPTQRFSLPSYVTYRTDRPANPAPNHQAGRNPGGGTAVMVHRRLTHRHVPLQLASLEATCVAVILGGREVHIAAAYSPPNAPFPQDDLEILFRLGGPSLIGGDFNAKHVAWHCRRTNGKGRLLLQLTEGLQGVTVTAPESPTHYSARGTPDVLDIAVHKDLPFDIAATTLDELSSDHLPVLFDLDTTPLSRYPRAPTSIRTDWRRYHALLADRLPTFGPAESKAGLDAQVAALQRAMTEAMEASSKEVPKVTTQHPLPGDIRAAIDKRRRLLRAWHRLRHPDTKRRLNAQNSLVKRLLDDHQTDTWTAYLDSLDIDDGSVWKTAKALRQPKATSHPLHGQHGLAYSARAKAEAFADSLQEQFTVNPGIYDVDTLETVANFMENYFNQAPVDDEDEGLQPITPEEVTVAISKVKPRKSPGLDKIGARALHSSPPALQQTLTTIFNSALSLRHFPQPWKVAKVVLIQKPGKSPLHPQNFRPISLLPTISKIFERLFLDRLTPFLEGVIRPEQFGFRRGHSTTLQLTRVLTHLVDKHNLGSCTAAALLDVSKAFDRVWHDGLLFKLSRTPLPAAAVHLCWSYLTGRLFRVSVDGELSTTRPVGASVPQGGVLAPLLYLIYTNDIPITPESHLGLYADDVFYYCSSVNPRRAVELLQRQLDTLSPWLRKWRIGVNPDKTQVILFKKPRKMPRELPPQLTMDGVPLPWKKEVKYLGVRLDWRLSFTPHVTAKVLECRKITGLLGPMLWPSSPIPTTAKVLVFLLVVRSTLLYASPAWWALTNKTSRKLMEAVQTKALRSITRSPWFVRNDVIRESLQIPQLNDFVKTTAAKIFRRAAESEFQHVAALARREGAPEVHRPRPAAVLDLPP